MSKFLFGFLIGILCAEVFSYLIGSGPGMLLTLLVMLSGGIRH